MTDAAPQEKEPEVQWSGEAGRRWVEAQSLLDGLFRPIEDVLIDTVMTSRPGHVLDIGCGTGGVLRTLEKRIGSGGRCVGIDVSGPMIEAARRLNGENGAQAQFIHADAQSHAFQQSAFDALMSRFGVMFFGNPTRAFLNLRKATRGGGKLHFVAWRAAEQNPFMTAAERAARPLLPNLPDRDPDAPGQFAFADDSRIFGILDDSGWTNIGIEPIDIVCEMPEEKLEHYMTRMGPVGRVLHEAEPATRSKVVEVLKGAFAPYVTGGTVRFTAACWKVFADTPS